MRYFLALAMVGLTGCAMPTTMLTKPPEGYQAIRFAETVRLPGGIGNSWEFPVGTVLTADRRRDRDGSTLYCGQMLNRDAVAATLQPMCVLWRGGKIAVGAEYLERGYEREVPVGSVEEIRLR